jgi:hypothetical protein
MTRPRRPRGPSLGHRALTRHGTALMACLALALLGSLALGPSAVAVGQSTSAVALVVGGDDDRCHPWDDWCQDDDNKCHPWWKCDNDDEKCHPWWKCDNNDEKCHPWWKCDDDRSTAPRLQSLLR